MTFDEKTFIQTYSFVSPITGRKRIVKRKIHAVIVLYNSNFADVYYIENKKLLDICERLLSREKLCYKIITKTGLTKDVTHIS